MTRSLETSGTVRVVFTALLLDLLAFTVILPLFPRLLSYYQHNEADNQDTLLGYAMQLLTRYKHWTGPDRGDKWDTVLLGGLIGSLFSFLQFAISPIIGRASDTLGRRRVLLWTMWGNILSTLVWLFARSFTTFLCARTIAGLSEGNVQLSIAIISDVTTPTTRSRSLAMVGIAFAIAFTVGPALGAWFASIDLTTYPLAAAWNLYPYSAPALLSLVLLVVETAYLYRHLPETHQHKPESSSQAIPAVKRQTNLKRLNRIHGLYLFVFSGMEFTLVFLTFDVLDYSHMQQGKLLGCMGILSALIQGGYVRRCVQRLGEKALVLQGMISCTIGLAALAMMAHTSSVAWLWTGVACLALSSGTVVNCLTSLASLQCESDLQKGQVLGEFRSFGQLGRALGPVSACGLYWIAGPASCYGLGAVIIAIIACATLLVVPFHKTKAS